MVAIHFFGHMTIQTAVLSSCYSSKIHKSCLVPSQKVGLPRSGNCKAGIGWIEFWFLPKNHNVCFPLKICRWICFSLYLNDCSFQRSSRENLQGGLTFKIACDELALWSCPALLLVFQLITGSSLFHNRDIHCQCAFGIQHPAKCQQSHSAGEAGRTRTFCLCRWPGSLHPVWDKSTSMPEW